MQGILLQRRNDIECINDINMDLITVIFTTWIHLLLNGSIHICACTERIVFMMMQCIQLFSKEINFLSRRL